MRALGCVGLPLLAISLSAQQELMMQFGTVIAGGTGNRVATAGDMDGDQVPDLLVASHAIGLGRVEIVSGATGAKRFINNTVSGSFATSLMFVSEDMNMDGVPDVVVNRDSGLVAYSGTDGSLLWQTNGMVIVNAVPVGDLDGDMRGDLAVLQVISNDSHLRTLRGSDGSLLSFGPSFTQSYSEMTLLGDLDGINGPEVAVRASTVRVYTVSNMSLGASFSSQAYRLFAADITGDGRNEIMADIGSGVMHGYDALTGGVVRTFVAGWQNQFASIGDLNGDGADDLAFRRGNDVEFVSGIDGAILSTWLGSVFFSCAKLAPAGDVDGDGYGDLLVGDPSAHPIAGVSSSQSLGGFQLISGRVLATMESKPVQCFQGPFAPELGITRPRLGENLLVVGRDSPLATVGFLAFSPQPAYPTSLGVVGCDAWFDTGAGVLLNTSTMVNWQVTVPIPLAPQLAGYRIALQAFFVPTFSPIGMDLSNGIWGTLGF